MRLILILLLVLLATTGDAEVPDWDEAAYQTAQQLFPYAGFVAKVRYPNSATWTYEFYRIELFGRPLLLSRGSSWQEMFDRFSEQQRRPLPLPMK